MPVSKSRHFKIHDFPLKLPLIMSSAVMCYTTSPKSPIAGHGWTLHNREPRWSLKC